MAALIGWLSAAIALEERLVYAVERRFAREWPGLVFARTDEQDLDPALHVPDI